MADILEKLKADQGPIQEWFEYMHRHPELSMQEDETAEYIADIVRQWGYEVETGVGKHGIVASLKVGESAKSIGLRADFDALPIQEVNDLAYKSGVDGVAHLCGHDGHTAMLLAAGKYLSETKNFDGTVRLIFQPGEETMEGGPAMIRDGLFDRFPVDAIFGMHNSGLALGSSTFPWRRDGCVDNCERRDQGQRGHVPSSSADPIVAASSLVCVSDDCV